MEMLFAEIATREEFLKALRKQAARIEDDDAGFRQPSDFDDDADTVRQPPGTQPSVQG